jgi:hypothetical protein
MKNQPLRCTIEDGKLIVSIGIDVLAWCAREHPSFWNGEDDDTPNINVTDPEIFAREIQREMEKEAEDGSTLVNRMIDMAIQNAYEDGCQGVAYE